MTDTTPFPAFAEWLANQPTDFLAQLLRERPDVVTPPPKSSAVLAARLNLRASVVRVLPSLAALPLACIEVAASLRAVGTPVAAAELIAQMRSRLDAAAIANREQPSASHIRQALDELRHKGLIWGNGPGPKGSFSGKSRRKEQLPFEDHFVLVDEALTSLPPGWSLIPDPHRPSVAALRQALAQVSPRQRRLLETLAESGGVGVSKDAAADADPQLPIPALIRQQLLERIDDNTVRLPARVRAVMRGGTVLEEDLSLRPSSPETTVVSGGNARAAAQAWETVRRVSALLKHLGTHPAPTLKDGVIGVRETRHLLESLQVDISELALIIDLARTAGLVHVGTPHPLPLHDTGGDYLAPTLAADAFLATDLAHRWASLLMSLRHSDYAAWRVDQLTEEGKRIPLLSAQAQLSIIPATREMLVHTCAATAGSGEPSCDEVHALVDLPAATAAAFPITHARTSPAVRHGVLSELTQLGVVVAPAGAPAGASAGTPSSVGLTAAGHAWRNHMWDSTIDQLAQELAPLLPAPATSFMVQADHTIVVPGIASAEWEATLESIAELESPGFASVYRITEDSLTRALDSGLSATAITQFLSDGSATGVPQSVEFLLADVARRHGRLRAGPAASFIRCDDAALLATLLSDPVAEKLGLRRIADTVAISQAPLDRVFEATRQAGYSFVAEDATGAVLDMHSVVSRIEAPAPPPSSRLAATALPYRTVESGRIDAALEAIAAGDRAEAASPARSGSASPHDGTGTESTAPGGLTGTAAYSLLQRSAHTGSDVVIDYVDRNGRASKRRVRPVTVSSGQIDAIDPATGSVLRFLLHRITTVTPAP